MGINAAYKFAISAKNDTKGAFDAINKDLQKSNVNISAMKQEMRSLTNAAGMGLVGGLGAAVGGIGTMLVQTADAAREIQNLSDIAGVTSETLQTVAYGAKAFGVEQSDVSDVLKDVNDKLGDFMQTGAGPMVDFFEQIGPKVGVTADQFRNLNSADALQLYVSSLEKANVSQAEMTFYMEAIASNSTALLPLFEKNGEALAAQAEEAEKLGLVLSNTDVAMLDMADKQMDKVAGSLKSFSNEIATEFAPIMLELSNEFLNMAKEAGGFGSIATRVFDASIKAVGYLGNSIRGLEVIWHGLRFVAVTFIEESIRLFEQFETAGRAAINWIPGVEVSAESAIGNMRQSFTNVRHSIEQDIHESLMKPIPSEAITLWAEEVKTKSEEVARTIAAAKDGRIDNGAGGVVGFDAANDPEVLEAQARMQELQLLKDVQLQTDLENEELQHLSSVERLRAQLEEKEITRQEFYDRELALIGKWNAGIRKVNDKKSKEDLKNDKTSFSGRLGMLHEFASSASEVSDDMLKVSQITGAAQALIATFQGQAEALKLGFPQGLIAAVKVGAAGFGFVNAIKSTTKGSSGSPSSGVTSPTSLGSQSNGVNQPPSSSGNTQTFEPQQVTNVTMIIEPDSDVSDKKLRKIIDGVVDQVENLNVEYIARS